MTICSRSSGGLLALVLAPLILAAQAPTPAKWSVEDIHGPSRKIAFTTDEGTWISVDVSPDGKSIVFDLLGDLYTLPIGGGKATRLTSGTRWDATPRYSPDGTRLLFASDPSGSDQIWVMPVAGGAPRQITQEGLYQYLQPAWDPSGDFVLSLRETRPFAPSDWVMVNVGGGQGTVVAEPGASGVAPSADGRWLYYATTLATAGSQSRIVRMDRRSGERLTIISGYEQLRRPAVSRDGRWLAFVATVDAKPRLIVRDLETGVDRTLYAGLSYLPTWGTDDLDAAPGFAFTPEGESIVFTADGKIRRVAVRTGVTSVIPFSADVDLTVTERVQARHKLDDGPFSPKVLHWVQRIDGGQFVLHAAGRLYQYDPASAKAMPFAAGAGLEFSPAVSADGKSVAYVEWSDAEGGRLMIAPAAGGAARAVAVRAGRYQGLSWSPDGSRLVVAEQRLEPDGLSEQATLINLVDLAGAGGADRLRTVTTVAPRSGWRKPSQRPTFDAAGARVSFVEAVPTGALLCSVNLEGLDRRCPARFKAADEIVPSPDGRWVAFGEMQNAYLAPLPPGGREPIDIVPEGGAMPVYRLGPQGDFFYWRNGSRDLLWNWARDVYEVSVADVVDGGKITPRTTSIAFQIPRAEAKGQVLLKNARLVTMKGDQVIERGDLLVSDGRISAVGPAGQVKAPAGATVMDLSGKTVIPGFIDLHAHYILDGTQWQGDLHQQQDPHLLANLAYGVTTWRDPSIGSRTLFALGEMVESGATVGPRLHGTGDIFIVYEPLCCGWPKDPEDALRLVRNQKALGATSIKEHTVPRRDHVQWIIAASRAESLQVVEDPARGPRREIRPLLDGATSLEHAFSGLPMKKDVIQVLAQTGAFYVPTLIVSVFEPWFMTTMNPHDDAKLRRFVPHAKLDQEIHDHNKMFMPHEVPTWYAEQLKDLVRAGGKVGMGSHGQLQGLGAHWEVWAMASAGLTPMEAIRTATMTAAETMGMEADLGSLEPGKLADLIVLDRNPLADLKNTAAIRYVMKAGTLWNGDTMDEVWPVRKTRPRALWDQEK